jgi:hypothetical protein
MDIYKSFRNLSSPFNDKYTTAILRHSEQYVFPSPQIVLCFTDLSGLVLEIFRSFKKLAQTLIGGPPPARGKGWWGGGGWGG